MAVQTRNSSLEIFNSKKELNLLKLIPLNGKNVIERPSFFFISNVREVHQGLPDNIVLNWLKNLFIIFVLYIYCSKLTSFIC